MATGLTNAQIIELLNTDFEFGINFIIDNNPQAVESNINALNLPLPTNPSTLQLRETIDNLLENSENTQSAQADIEYILNVPYDDTANNYTGGFASYFQSKQSQNPNVNSSVAVAVITAIGSIVGGVSNFLTSKNNEDMLEIQQQMQQDQIQYELDRIERTKVLGIPQAVFIAVLGFLMFMILIMFLTKK